MRRSGLWISVRVVLGYLFFASLWILLSDRLVETIASDADTYARMQTGKGLMFVAASAILIFWLLQRELNARHKDEDRRRAAEEALQQSEARLTEAQRIAKLGGWEFDATTERFFWTDETARIHDLDPVAAVDREFAFSFYPEEHRIAAEAALLCAREKATPFDLELEINTAKGVHKWVRILGRPTAVNGSCVKLVGSIQDITAQKESEAARKKLEEQLAVSQQLESVGRLAGGVAHDFNNLLTVILYHAGVLEELPDSRDDAARIREAGERAAALTQRLLAFSRKQAVRPEIINLNDIILSLEKMLRRLIGEDIEISMGLDSALSSIKADASQVEQIILNLAVNARDAMPTGGRIRIETREIEIGPSAAENVPSLSPGRYVEMTFVDTGQGMDEETRRRAFEPFFTTKEAGKGTGLGLATVLDIVAQSNGHIMIESEPCKGTAVRTYLPCVSAPAPGKAVQPRLQHHEVLGRGETILAAEDDPMIRDLSKEILENAGFRVLASPNAQGAISIAANPGIRIDLLLTDVIMPQMNGRALAERVLSLQPWVKVVFMSGYTDDILAPQGVIHRDITLLEKPFSRYDLASTVRSVLDGALPGGIGNTSSALCPSPSDRNTEGAGAHVHRGGR